ncbi:hypothetical protein [Ornithinimicrobium kibberense]
MGGAAAAVASGVMVDPSGGERAVPSGQRPSTAGERAPGAV